ncbi:MAG: O-antigen ligase family protein [Pseudomonadaceae bacterium]|nr:O-antigen ligase family protein [Pseudomonadaceae bacterium]
MKNSPRTAYRTASSGVAILPYAWGSLCLLAALALGGATPVAGPGVAAAAALLAALTLLRVPLGGFPFIWMALAMAPLLWACVQTLPMHAPWANPLWMAATNAGIGNTPSISINPPATWDALARGTALLTALAAAWAIGSSRRGAVHMLRALALAGTVVCAYGLVVGMLGNTQVMTLPKAVYFDSLTASFINRNSFATFAGLTLLACMAVVVERAGEIPSTRQAGWRQRWQAVLNLVVLPRWGYALGALAALLAVVLSHSRAGLASTLVGGIVFIIALGGRGKLLRTGGMAAMALTVAGLVMAGMGGGSRFALLAGDADVRLSLYRTVWRGIETNLWWGTGLGTFEDAFRIVRTPELPLTMAGRVDHAHSTWLQWLLELGLPAFIAVVACVAWMLWRYGRGVALRRRGAVFPALGLAVVVLVGKHALVDFSLEIPAVGLMAALLVGTTLAQSLPSRQQGAPTASWWRGPLLIMPALAAGGFSLLTAVQAKMFQPVTLAAHALRQGQQVEGPTLAAARYAVLTSPLWQAPLPATFAEQQAMHDVAIVEMGLVERLNTSNPPAAKMLALGAETHVREALATAPADPYGWARLATLHKLFKQPQAAATALDMSLMTGAWEPQLVWARLPLLADLLPYLPPEDGLLLTRTLQEAWRSQPYKTWELVRTYPALASHLQAAIGNDAHAMAQWMAFGDIRDRDKE